MNKSTAITRICPISNVATAIGSKVFTIAAIAIEGDRDKKDYEQAKELLIGNTSHNCVANNCMWWVGDHLKGMCGMIIPR